MNKSLVDPVKQTQKRIAAIQSNVAAYFAISASEIGQAREPHPTLQQMVAIAVVYQAVPLSVEELGAHFKCQGVTIQKSLDSLEKITACDKDLKKSISDMVRALTAENVAPSIFTMDTIMRVVAEHFGLKVNDLISERRMRNLVRPRQIAMYLAKELTARSLPAIGAKLGGRDHTTIMHGIAKIEELRQSDEEIDRALFEIRRKLSPHYVPKT